MADSSRTGREEWFTAEPASEATDLVRGAGEPTGRRPVSASRAAQMRVLQATLGNRAVAARRELARQAESAVDADQHFNPGSITDDLIRAIDQSDVIAERIPPMEPGKPITARDFLAEAEHALRHTEDPGFPAPPFGCRWVRKVDAAKVTAVLNDLTPSQVKAVRRLYQEFEKRPLDEDLFRQGESHHPSNLTPDQRDRIAALLQGTRAEKGATGADPHDSRLHADAVELHELLSGDLEEAQRERVMVLFRRPNAEIAGIDAHYQQLYRLDLKYWLGLKFAGLQAARVFALRSGDVARADALAIEDKRRAIADLSVPIEAYKDPFGEVARKREEERVKLIGGIETIVATNRREAIEDPANAGKSASAAVEGRLAAVFGTRAEPVHGFGGAFEAMKMPTLGESLTATLGPAQGGAITAMSHGSSAPEVAAHQLREMEVRKTTKTDKVAELLRGLHETARHDIGAAARDPNDPRRDAIASDLEGAIRDLATEYTKAFATAYDVLALRAEGRTYAQILASADDYNTDMLKALTARGGIMTPAEELDHAIRAKDNDAIKAVLQRQKTQADIERLIASYEGRPAQRNLRQTLFGIGSNAVMAAELDRAFTGALLTGRDASLAGEALDKPKELGGIEEVTWLASYGQQELAVTEDTKGDVATIRSWTGDPETERLMKRSAHKLVELETEWKRSDPWGSGRPRTQILAEMRNWRATLTGDATAYEEENERIIAEIRGAVSFAVQIALAIALPGIGEGFLATTALNIGATAASNMVIYGDKYSLTNLRDDIIGGGLGALGGKIGEEFVGAVASEVAGRSASSAAAAAERAGLSAGLAKEAADAARMATEGALAVKVLQQGASIVVGAEGSSVVTGQSLTPEGLLQAAFMGLIGGKAKGKGEGTVLDAGGEIPGGKTVGEPPAASRSSEPVGAAPPAERPAETQVREGTAAGGGGGPAGGAGSGGPSEQSLPSVIVDEAALGLKPGEVERTAGPEPAPKRTSDVDWDDAGVRKTFGLDPVTGKPRSATLTGAGELEAHPDRRNYESATKDGSAPAGQKGPFRGELGQVKSGEFAPEAYLEQFPEGGYAVRVGGAGSWVDHVFTTRAEAELYAAHLSATGEGQIREASALPYAWPPDASGKMWPGNPVDSALVFEVPKGTLAIRSEVAPQPESSPEHGAGDQPPKEYAGGGPQVQLPRGALYEPAEAGARPRARTPVAEYPVPRPGDTMADSSPGPKSPEMQKELQDSVERAIEALDKLRPAAGESGGSPVIEVNAPSPRESTAALADGPVIGEVIPPDRLRDTYGMPEANAAKFQRICQEHNAIIDVRPTTKAAPALLEEGALPKREDLKSKTIDSDDLLLGARREDIGKVGYFKPEPPERPSGMQDDQWRRVVQRYAQRDAEYWDNARRMTELQSRPELQTAKSGAKDDRGTHQDTQVSIGETGTVSGTVDEGGALREEPFTGDHDVFDIRKADGSEFTPEEYNEIVEEMKAAGMGVAHGAHMKWIPQTPAEKAIYRAIVNRHMSGAEPLIRFQPGSPPTTAKP